jgi:hypothetical protein
VSAGTKIDVEELAKMFEGFSKSSHTMDGTPVHLLAAQIMRAQVAELDRLRAEVERLRADAERFHWLKKRAWAEALWNGLAFRQPTVPKLVSQSFEEAIDVARTPKEADHG